MSHAPSAPYSSSRRWLAVVCLVLAGAGIAAGVTWWRPSPKQRAERALAANRPTEAAAFYEEHLRSSPDDHEARIALGVLLRSVDTVRAIESFEAVPEGSPEHPLALRHIAEIAMTLEADGRAEKALRALLRLAPDDDAAQLLLAELYHRQKQPKEALPHALRAAELNPERMRAWLLLADIQDALNRTHEMIVPLRRALKLDPNLLEAHLDLAYALVWSGEIDEGRREAEWCLKRDPNNVGARRMLAICERDAGRPEQALEEIRHSLEFAPDDLGSRIVEAQLLLFLKRADEAYRHLRPLLSRHGDDPQVLKLLSRAAAATGRREEAEEYRQRSEGHGTARDARAADE
jgi:predicted Zn-dependent protease